MGIADEEYAYGSGNGGRACTGVSCLTIILSIFLLLFIYIVPVATSAITSTELFSPYTDACGWSCCCFGSIGLLIGIALIFTDDPEKNKKKERQRALKAKKAKQGR
ncbi:MAG: hypothetical protein ACI9MC_002994 [Kiritimatiellia bacterium]|jgi:hypothetical protein